MRTLPSFHSTLAIAALCASAFTPAAAQRTTRGEFLRTVANGNVAPVVRALAVYELEAAPDGMPTRVTVSDSAGTLVASYRVRGTGAERPMRVSVADSDILLEGETPRGTLTIVLYDGNDRSGPDVLVGRWALGSRRGELRGRATY